MISDFFVAFNDMFDEDLWCMNIHKFQMDQVAIVDTCKFSPENTQLRHNVVYCVRYGLGMFFLVHYFFNLPNGSKSQHCCARGLWEDEEPLDKARFDSRSQ